MSSLEIYFLDRKNLNLLQSNGQEEEEREVHWNNIQKVFLVKKVWKLLQLLSDGVELNTNIDLGQVDRLLAKHDWKNR